MVRFCFSHDCSPVQIAFRTYVVVCSNSLTQGLLPCVPYSLSRGSARLFRTAERISRSAARGMEMSKGPALQGRAEDMVSSARPRLWAWRRFAVQNLDGPNGAF